MRSIPDLRVTLVLICSACLAVHAQTPVAENSAGSRGPTGAYVADAGSRTLANAPTADVESQTADVVMQPLAPGTQFARTLVMDGVVVPSRNRAADVETAIATGEERLIYSNTLGRVAADFGANRLISDDITTTALSGCALSRFSFDVDGRVNEAAGQPGGPYTVSWTLYNTCPYSVTPGPQRLARIIHGNAGSVTIQEDGPRTIDVVLPSPAPIPNHLWLGLTFSRANAGAIMGAPAMVGFTADVIDFPGSACNASLGVFPANPHASFNVRMWGVNCPEVNLKYQNRLDSAGAINIGANQWATDGITLLAEPCLLRGYSVGVRGPGTYNFELQESCGGPVIPGTEKMQVVSQASGQEPRIFEYTFDPPIAVPREFAYAVKVNNMGAGPIGYAPASIPVSGECLEPYAPECTVNSPQALHFAIICDGAAPVGACCDMYITQCVGGSDDGQPCSESADCASPGTCESVCREVPQLNCPFRQSCTQLRPKWDEGKTCASDAEPDGAFPGHICGQAACCTPDDTCLNLTKNECDGHPPVDEPHHWQMGWFCGEGGQYCPFAACVARDEGTCYFADHTPGCSDSECCQRVCGADSWCCRVEWDRECVELASWLCYLSVANDTCGPTPENSHAGAALIEPNASVTFTNVGARADLDKTSCNLSEYRCVIDGAIGAFCGPDNECTLGVCTLFDGLDPETVWFKFTASHSSAQISTCNSPTAVNALIHVFEVDKTGEGEAPCDHLSLLSCTAADGCGSTGQACLCVQPLTVGAEYYVMIGSSSYLSDGVYQLDITSPCGGARCCPRKDCNNNCVDDFFETFVGDTEDCNFNYLPDECDFVDRAVDCDSNGVLDECQYYCSWGFNPDFDCDRDLRDFAGFQNCFSVEARGDLGCCYMMDYLTGDGTPDLRDYSYLDTLGLNGPD